MQTLLLLTFACLLGSFNSQNPGWLEEGAICRKRNSEEGICTHFSECTSAISEVERNGRPEICSFDGKTPIVCCADKVSITGGNLIQNPGVRPSIPSQDSDRNIESKNEGCQNKNDKAGCGNRNSTVNAPTLLPNTTKKDNKVPGYRPFDENSKSLKACRKYHTYIPKEIGSTAFFSGRNSYAKEFPHMAVLGYGNPDNIEWQCGGALISLEFVMTAAHCLYSRTHGQVRYVRLGELDLNSTTDDADPQDFTIAKMHPHPDYTPLSKYNDIALLRLDRQAKLTDYVKPACLPVPPVPNPPPFIILPEAMGWGLTSLGGSTANILQTGLLRFITLEKCKAIYGMTPDLREGILGERQLCADGNGTDRDTCQGDSGGPLQVRNYEFKFGRFPEILGVTSFGKQCGLTAGVYTRVYHYVPWIEKIVFPN